MLCVCFSEADSLFLCLSLNFWCCDDQIFRDGFYPTATPTLGAPAESGSLSGVPIFSMAGAESDIPLATGSKSVSLLPLTASSREASGSSTLSLTVPQKLAKRILDLEYVEMSELLPETWGLEPDATYPCCHETRRQACRGPVTDILLWVECYSSLIAVLATKFPQHIGDFMTYQKTIIKACKNFEGTAWVVYDRCYRRRAAATKSLDWALIDSALYNEAFTGRARAIPRCHFCLSDNHTGIDCPDRMQQGLNPPGWGSGKAPRWPVHPARPVWYGGQSAQMGRPPSSLRPASQEICQLFNQAKCKAVWCKRRHVCNRCGLPHPEVLCTPGMEQRHRSRSPGRRSGKTD